MFGDGRHVLLLKTSFSRDDELTRLELQRIAEASKPRSTTWPESTFFADVTEPRHSMGAHWEPFAEDSVGIVKRLPEIVSKAQLLKGFGYFYKASRSDPADWPRGGHMVWPGPDHGIVVTLRFEETANKVVSVYPYFGDVGEATLRIDRVIVWEGGVEAQIEAEWNDARITFFDTHFLINRAWYEAGESYDFILAGIAYSAEPATVMELPYTPNPEQVAWEKVLATLDAEKPRTIPSKLRLAGVAWLGPISQWDVDDYCFRGPVKTVKPVSAILGQDGWRVRVTIDRPDSGDADLDILITRQVWKGAEPPAVGQDIEGNLWLQGHLWTAQRWVDGR